MQHLVAADVPDHLAGPDHDKPLRRPGEPDVQPLARPLLPGLLVNALSPADAFTHPRTSLCDLIDAGRALSVGDSLTVNGVPYGVRDGQDFVGERLGRPGAGSVAPADAPPKRGWFRRG